MTTYQTEAIRNPALFTFVFISIIAACPAFSQSVWALDGVTRTSDCEQKGSSYSGAQLMILPSIQQTTSNDKFNGDYSNIKEINPTANFLRAAIVDSNDSSCFVKTTATIANDTQQTATFHNSSEFTNPIGSDSRLNADMNWFKNWSNRSDSTVHNLKYGQNLYLTFFVLASVWVISFALTGLFSYKKPE